MTSCKRTRKKIFFASILIAYTWKIIWDEENVGKRVLNIYYLSTHFQKRPRCCRSSNTECWTHVVSSIILLYAFYLESSLQCNMMTIVSVIGKHELLHALLCPINWWLRISRCDTFKFSYLTDSYLYILWFNIEHWQCCFEKGRRKSESVKLLMRVN